MITARKRNRKWNYVVAIAAFALVSSLALVGAASGSVSASSKGSTAVPEHAPRRVTTAVGGYSDASSRSTAATGLAKAAAPATLRPAGWWAANAWWTWRPAYGGWTLSIAPTGLAQAWGTGATSRVWSDALSIAGMKPLSSYAYNSMYEQLECHLWFTFKTPYNLDSWRPQVAWWYELYRLCNP